MTIPESHLLRPARPGLRGIAYRAFLGGFTAVLALAALAGLAAVARLDGVMWRLVEFPSWASLADPAAVVAGGVVVAVVFTAALTWMLQRDDGPRVAPERVFACVLAGVVVTVVSGPAPDDDGSNALVGAIVTVLAMHWLVYGAQGVRRPLLPRRTVARAGVALFLLGLAATFWTAWVAPVTLSTSSSPVVEWTALPAGTGPNGRSQVTVRLENTGPRPITLTGVRSATPGLDVRDPVRLDDLSDRPGFRAASLARGETTEVRFVTGASCGSADAVLRLAYAGGGTSDVRLTGSDSDCTG